MKEAELLGAMDWLLKRQSRIERALARRHLGGEGFVLYDLSSSYVEGRCCPLAALGYSRDGKRGTLQVNYGLICSPEGRPVGVASTTAPRRISRRRLRRSRPSGSASGSSRSCSSVTAA